MKEAIDHYMSAHSEVRTRSLARERIKSLLKGRCLCCGETDRAKCQASCKTGQAPLHADMKKALEARN